MEYQPLLLFPEERAIDRWEKVKVKPSPDCHTCIPRLFWGIRKLAWQTVWMKWRLALRRFLLTVSIKPNCDQVKPGQVETPETCKYNFKLDKRDQLAAPISLLKFRTHKHTQLPAWLDLNSASHTLPISRIFYGFLESTCRGAHNNGDNGPKNQDNSTDMHF